MIDEKTLRQIEQELLFTDTEIADVLDRIGSKAIPEEIERELSLVVCPGCNSWVYRETVRNELCIDCEAELTERER